MTSKTRRAIDDEINSLLLDKCSNNKRDTGEAKALRALKLGGQEDEKCSEDFSPSKVWKMLTTDAEPDFRWGNSIKIGLVNDTAVNMGKPRGGPAHHNKIQAMFLSLT